MYIELLKNCLLDNIYSSEIMQVTKIEDIEKIGQDADIDMINNGYYFPKRAHTMIGMKRLTNIEECIKNILKENIEGDFIETGVWRGGATIFMAGLNKYFNLNRKIFVADSFEGLPPPDPKYIEDKDDNLYKIKWLAIDIEEVQNNFKKYNLLDDNVIFIKGFFENSLKNASINKLALLRLDGDMYSSTIQVLEELYDKVSIGGYIIIDDYGCTAVACKKAVDDFRNKRNITTEIQKIDWHGVFWKKEF
jgi:hypothetical protein